MIAVPILAGFGLLLVGAELLVRGSARLARAVGLSPLIIGLTVVAFGTSSPELAVSVKASLSGQSDIALGNVVGSNTFNIFLVLGLSAAIAPLRISRQLVRMDVPVMILVSAVTWLLCADGRIGRVEGLMLLAGLAVYTFVLLRMGGTEPAVSVEHPSEKLDSAPARKRGPLLVPAIIAALGLVLLVLGARWLVSGAVALAARLGVGELIIGLTLVAAGTSLPEAATSVVAAIRGERDIAVGNAVGSNIFNLLAVLGTSAAVSGGVRVVPTALRFDIPVMVATSVACLPIFFTGARISRWEGALFLLYYCAYVAYLFLAASQHESLPVFSRAMMWFVLPATVLGIGLSVLYVLRAGRRA